MSLKNIMQEYQIKRGYTKQLRDSMVGPPRPVRDRTRSRRTTTTPSVTEHSWAEVWVGEGGKTLVVDTEADRTPTMRVIIDTNRRFETTSSR